MINKLAIKRLVKLSMVDTRHLIKYKNRIDHSDDNNTVVDLLSSVKLDALTILSVKEINEVLVGSSFSETSSVDLESLKMINIKELKSSFSRGK